MLSLIEKPGRLEEEIARLKKKGDGIGFVPTMGALHEGHFSLIKAGKKDNDHVVVSIFVNPTQFDDPEDYRNYPQSIEADMQVLKRINCDYLFYPSEETMYPEGRKLLDFDPGYLGKILEGKKRKGHFQGVATIVKKLFDIVKPDRAYFGQKDYQQYMIIKKMVEDFKMNIEVVLCPTVREKDGLAMSSRNMRLNAQERKTATAIFKTLGRAKIKLNSQKPAEVTQWAAEYLNAYPSIDTEYFEILNAKDLKPFKDLSKVDEYIICTAVKLGKIRLIDNIIVKQ